MNQTIIIVLVVVLVIGLGLGIFWWRQNQAEPISSQTPTPEEPADQQPKLVALGSSISKATNLSSKLVGDNEEYSFATGTEIKSIYLRLKNLGEDIGPVNLASAGATIGNVLADQVGEALEYDVKFVILDPGADLVIGTSIKEYQESLNQIIDQLKSNDRVIMIATYPNFVKLRQSYYPSCEKDKLGLGLADLTEAKIKEFNRVIKKIAKQNNLVLADLYQALGEPEVSDYDCFHPSIDGQKKIAQKFIKAYNRQ